MAPWWGDDGGWWHVTYAARMDRRVSMAACNTVEQLKAYLGEEGDKHDHALFCNPVTISRMGPRPRHGHVLSSNEVCAALVRFDLAFVACTRHVSKAACNNIQHPATNLLLWMAHDHACALFQSSDNKPHGPCPTTTQQICLPIDHVFTQYTRTPQNARRSSVSHL